MSENTKIEWCDHTFNGWTGCTKVSLGCANCYAEGWAKRSGIVQWGPGAPRRRTSEANWKQPLKWNREARELAALQAGSVHGAHRRPRVFCSSLADWLDDEVPIGWLADLLALIHATPNLDWLLLTKRPENCRTRMLQVIAEIPRNNITFQQAEARCMAEALAGAPYASNTCLENVWIGTSVENQEMADKRIPLLLRIPARVRFLSCEPLLGPVDLVNLEGFNILCDCGIDWIIAGGESGPHARPMHPDWARSLRDQLAAANVPFFMKQMGGVRKPFAPIPDDLNIRQFPTP